MQTLSNACLDSPATALMERPIWEKKILGGANGQCTGMFKGLKWASMLGWVGGQSGMSPWRKSVVGGVLFLPGRRGQEAPGLGVAGWTPVTEFLWLLKLRRLQGIRDES